MYKINKRTISQKRRRSTTGRKYGGKKNCEYTTIVRRQTKSGEIVHMKAVIGAEQEW